ncbi:MAG: hypothetical protein ACLQBJ_01555 [Bryobacteraceae bacterium]
MKSFLMVLGLLAAAVAAPPPAELPRIYLGDARHPVVYGEAWLVVHGWGDYPALLVGTIRAGKLEPEAGVPNAECSDWGDGCRLALGVAEKAPVAAPAKELDSAYGTTGSQLSRRFPILYLSAKIEDVERTADWLAGLNSLGRVEAAGVVLPRPEKRSLQLLYPDGRPFEGARARVALFGANNNHCGAALGFALGEPVSDAQGRIAVTAPGGPLAVSLNFYEEQSGGPAGTAYALRTDIATAAERDITLQRMWTLAQRDYALTVRDAGGQPMAGVRLSGCPWNPTCGADCGPLGGASVVSDAAGQVRWRDADLRRLRNVSLIDAGGRTMYLNADELRALLGPGAASVTWREPPRRPAAPGEH